MQCQKYSVLTYTHFPPKYFLRSVHIKVHVPEIIKKHTHVRTVYKHHYKTKPIKHSTKSKTRYHKSPPPPSYHHNYYDRQVYDGQDRHDPAIRPGTLQGKYQKYQWVDHLVPAASHVHAEHLSAAESSGSVNEPDVLTRWQHNFEKLNRQQATAKPKSKPKKRRPSTSVPTPLPSVPSYYSHEDESSDRMPHTLDFGFFDSYAGDRDRYFQESSDFRPSSLQLTAKRPEPKQHRSSPVKTISHSPRYVDTGSPNNHASKHRTQSHTTSHQTDFKPPRLLKITEEDIRPSKVRSAPQSTRSSNRNNSKNSNSNKGVGSTKLRSNMSFKNGNKDDSLPPLIASPSWDGYATDKPFPEYIHAVAAALQFNRPYDAQSSAEYHPESYGELRPSAMAMVHQMAPSQPFSQEEFMPFRSSVQMSSSNGNLGGDSFNMEMMPNIESAEDVDENGEQININEEDGSDENNDSSEFGPASFDEVPYQTFTKRKNLLRNSHRE